MATWTVKVPQSGYSQQIVASSFVDAVAIAFPGQEIRYDRQPNVFASNGQSIAGAYLVGVPPSRAGDKVVSVLEGPFPADPTGTNFSGAALNSYIAQCDGLGGGMVWLPRGNYRCDDAQVVMNTTNPVKLVGDGPGATSMQSNVLNQSVLGMGGTRNELRDILVFSNQLWTSGNVVQMFNCVEGKIDNCWIQGGFVPLAIIGTNTAGCIVTRSTMTFGAGNAQCYHGGNLSGTCGANFLIRCLLNQGYTPAGVPAPANFKGARTNTTAYNVKDVVNLSQGGQTYNLICQVAGTSGGSAPTVLWYGNNIADGGVTWQLLGNTSARGLLVDTGSTLSEFVFLDATGPYLNGFDVSNLLAGTAPSNIYFDYCNADGNIANAFNAGAVAGLDINGFKCSQGVGSGQTNGIVLNGGGVVEGIQIRGMRDCFGFTNGIQNNARRVKISDNIVTGNGTGILVGAAVTDFSITGNICGATTKRGANTNAITVTAGASDRYSIRDNMVGGATTGVTDGGTGVNKDVGGNF